MSRGETVTPRNPAAHGVRRGHLQQHQHRKDQPETSERIGAEAPDEVRVRHQYGDLVHRQRDAERREPCQRRRDRRGQKRAGICRHSSSLAQFLCEHRRDCERSCPSDQDAQRIGVHVEDLVSPEAELALREFQADARTAGRTRTSACHRPQRGRACSRTGGPCYRALCGETGPPVMPRFRASSSESA